MYANLSLEEENNILKSIVFEVCLKKKKREPMKAFQIEW
jgi:hypothetical protein